MEILRSSSRRVVHHARAVPPSAHVRVALTALAVVALTQLAAVVDARPARASAGSGAWARPVDGPVVRPFQEPAGPYAPGHRGVDFGAAPGTPVRAANSGVVAFAGEIAGTWHVTVAHQGGLRTSYSFLAGVSVRTGARVARGDVVGTGGGAGDGHDGTVVHFGLRIGDRYVDPMVLFAPDDLTKLVHLVPTRPPAEGTWSPVAERRALRESLGLAVPGTAAAEARAEAEAALDDASCGDGVPLVGAEVGAVCAVGEWIGDHADAALDAGLHYLDRVTATPTAVLDRWRARLHAALAAMRASASRLASALARTPTGAMVLDLVAIGRRFVDAVSADCSDHAPPADGSGGSRHRVMVVAGINSAGAAWDRGPTVDLDVTALGYHATEGEIRYFSYARDGGPYTAADTHGPIEVAAARLGAQLRAMQREQPGREVDLLAHSQGGVVVDYFLGHLYRPGDPTLPPLGNVVTLSSPHTGAPLATAERGISKGAWGRAVLDDTAQLVPVPPPGSRAVQELAEGSTLLRNLWRHGVPANFDFTTVGATEDVVVPATQIDVPGARSTVVGVDSPNEHHAIVNDPEALRAVRAALEGRPLPCVGLVTALRSAVAPVVISRFEHTAGRWAAIAGGAG